MIAGVGGLAAGFADPQYDKVGRMSALLAFGGLTAMASLAAVRPGGVFSQQVAPGAPSQITPAPKATPASTSASQIALPSGIVQQ
jgi:hypothetical protein